MAMICKTGTAECDGCGACFIDPKPIGRCAACKRSILASEDHYDIDDDLIHEDCLTDWAKPHLVRGC